MGLFNKWKKKVEVEPYRISAPVAGKVIDIKDTNDQVFNSEALGKGVGIRETNNCPNRWSNCKFFSYKTCGWN